MNASARTLCKAGLYLFVAGLALGFVLKLFPNPRAALSAHLNAVQSGTSLIALGLLWPKLAVWPRIRGALTHAIWIAFVGLEAGLVLAALVPAGAHPPAGLETAAMVLQGLSAVVMIVGVGALLGTFKPLSDPHPSPHADIPPR